MDDRRLIEDYLPLDEINAIASREKLHPRRYVELVHYWPARRPITASRAAICAALVPAPNFDDERKEPQLGAAGPADGLPGPDPSPCACVDSLSRKELPYFAVPDQSPESAIVPGLEPDPPGHYRRMHVRFHRQFGDP